MRHNKAHAEDTALLAGSEDAAEALTPNS
jgi:hypothetical protein